MSEVILTPHMREVMRVVIRGNSDGSFCDLDQVIDRVSYHTNKAAIQFVIRNLIAKGMLNKLGRETRRNRSRVVLTATPEGYAEMKPISDEDHEELVKLFS